MKCGGMTLCVVDPIWGVCRDSYKYTVLVPDSKEGSVERECALLNGYFYSSKSIV